MNNFSFAENDQFLAFLDILPVQKGHVLVVPKIEVDKVFELPDNYLSQILVFAKPIAAAIAACFPCDRVSMVTVGLEVPHAHLHLIPINQADDLNFANPKLQLSKEAFIEIQEAIIARLPVS